MRVFLLLIALAAALLLAIGPGQPPLSFAHWWLFNAEPPSVTVEAPASEVRHQVRFSVQLSPAGRASVVAASVDGQPLEPAEELVVDTASLPDGQHLLTVVARDHSRQRNTSQHSFTFVSDNTPPRLEVRLEPAVPTEGRTLVVRVETSEAGTISGNLGGRRLMFQGEGQQRWAVIGIPPEPAYRALDLLVEAIDATGNTGTWHQRYPLARTRFPLEELQVAPDLVPLLDDLPRALEQAQLMPMYAAASGPPRWSGRFTLPLEGPLTTSFGTRRSYNGRFPGGNHSGADFAAPLGAPVRAPANARVAFVGTLELRGNTLILDHGGGVFSTYAHLHEVLVGKGDEVRKGDRIALVGSTGLSTGPHLHWEIWVGEANVDPLEWTERQIP